VTGEERQRIRAAVDAAARERIPRAASHKRCAGCGVEHDRYLYSCKRCMERYRAKIERGYPPERVPEGTPNPHNQQNVRIRVELPPSLGRKRGPR
jgi:hypothetical protein